VFIILKIKLKVLANLIIKLVPLCVIIAQRQIKLILSVNVIRDMYIAMM
jgi:hypothetical protein